MLRHRPKTDEEREYIADYDDDSYDEQPYREKGTLAQSIIQKETEDEYYRFDLSRVATWYAPALRAYTPPYTTHPKKAFLATGTRIFTKK